MEITCPIIYLEDDRCTCPNCRAPEICLLSGDVDIALLSRDGLILSTKNLKHESTLICLNCRSKFDYTKKGITIIPIFAGGTNSGSNALEAQKINQYNPFSI